MRTVGTGEPLVILYRFRGTLVRWDPVLIDALARRRRVFDSLGVGDTPGEAPSTVEQMADFGADVLRPIGDSAVDVLGRSFGGLVAQKLAINVPRLVSQLVLAATMPPAGSAEVTWSQERLRNASNPVASVDAILPLFLTPTAASQSAGRESVTLTPCATATAVSPRSMAAQAEAMARFAANEGAWYSRLVRDHRSHVRCRRRSGRLYPAIDSAVLAADAPE
jgi:pimeloyl-ACP methyl ester carboxylesterase